MRAHGDAERLQPTSSHASSLQQQQQQQQQQGRRRGCSNTACGGRCSDAQEGDCSSSNTGCGASCGPCLAAPLPSGTRRDATSAGERPCCYAVGRSLTLADCGYPALFLYADLIIPVLGHVAALETFSTRWPHISAWRATLATDEHVGAAMQALGPGACAWLEKKLSCGSSGSGSRGVPSKL